MASSSDKPLLERLKERKLVQWALGYLAGAWVLLEVFSTIQEGFGWSQALFPIFFALLCIGFVVTLVLAWYHGEQGRQRVSGPELLIIAGLLVVAGIGFRVLLSDDSTIEVAPTASAEADAPVQPSVAVLPFVNMSGNPDNEYFSDGITEELLNALAQLPGLRVPGRTSSFAFKGQNITIRQIADTLGVAHVLEGSVRRDADRVLITAQLVDAQTDTHLWSNTFERELEDIFAIQREIAAAIADQLQVALGDTEQTTLVPGGTDSPAAHEAYLRGRYFWNQRTAEGLQAAILEFQTAVDLDPEYAEAYSGLADSYALVDNYRLNVEDLDYRTNLQQSLRAARTAVSLDPQLGMAHTSLGYALFQVGEWESAEQELERALELNPGYATAHSWLAVALYLTGRPLDAVGHAQRAAELDPVSPIISRVLGSVLWVAGQTDAAVEQFLKTAELAPDWSVSWFELAFIRLYGGDYDEGLEAWINGTRASGISGEAPTEAYRAAIRYRETGEPQPFSDFGGGWGRLLWLYGETGQIERAMELVEVLSEQEAYGRVAQVHTLLASASLRDDPRYQALLEEAGITW